MTKIIPVLRAFDRKKLTEFYVDWLGFNIEFEHAPPGAPFYVRVSLRGVVIDLSEHHGDSAPGAKILMADFEGLAIYHKTLLEKNYTYMRPGLELLDWDKDTISVTVIDPFFNRIEFMERVA